MSDTDSAVRTQSFRLNPDATPFQQTSNYQTNRQHIGEFQQVPQSLQSSGHRAQGNYRAPMTTHSYHSHHNYPDYHGYPGPCFTDQYNNFPFHQAQRFSSPQHSPRGYHSQSYQRRRGGPPHLRQSEQQRSPPGHFYRRSGYDRQGARPKQFSSKKERAENKKDGDARLSDQGQEKSDRNEQTNCDHTNSAKINTDKSISPDANTIASPNVGVSFKDRNDKSGKKLTRSMEDLESASHDCVQRESDLPRSERVKYATWHAKDKRKIEPTQKNQKDVYKQSKDEMKDKDDESGQGQSLPSDRRQFSSNSGKGLPRNAGIASGSSQNTDKIKTEQSNNNNSAEPLAGQGGQRSESALRKVRDKPWRKHKEREGAKSPDKDKPFKKESGGKSKSLKCWSTPQTSRSSSSGNFQTRNRRNAGNVSEASAESQTGSMIESLSDGSYECMVCCDVIRCESAVWSCQSCYTVFHLHCIKKWARSPVATLKVESADGWRCPACQNVCTKTPSVYRCFCGKVRDPSWQRTETPHSCGEVCRKRRTNTSCPHTCNILCHPGPCPTCPLNVTKTCACGKTKKSIRCGTAKVVHCEMICGKTLNCGIHSCKKICHQDKCGACDVMIKQECFCGKSSQEVVCGTEVDIAEDGPGCYPCQEKCGRQLPCGNHVCQDQCHAGPCQPCQLVPSVVTHCHCGQTPLTSLMPSGKVRTSCHDPIPTCEEICNKKLKCGSEDDPHYCKYTCHEGDCGPCTGSSTVRCQCGFMDKDMPCAELAVKGGPPLCDKRCNKKRKCGRHRCNQRCCVDKEHKCPLVCGRKLSCGLHKCEEPCHPGNCEQCWQTGFDELACHCGATILFPPIPCGTRVPECGRLCVREHDCEHPVQHSCHSEEQCPPCTFLVKRQCMGKHEMRSNIPCHIKDISCGRACGKALPCGQHKCLKICHKNDCDEVCNQPCNKIRSECGHWCAAQCHPGKPCPKIACKTLIKITCKCGNRQEKAPCLQGGDALQMVQNFQRMATSQLASTMHTIQSGQSVDISSLMQSNDGLKQRQLECTEECAVVERNRRFADALQIQNPDLSSKISSTVYCQFLKDQARQNATFVASVEKDLANLIKSLQQSKLLRKSHSFPNMNRDQRRVVHELAEVYGCETQSYDQEPKRNTIATAVRNKSQIPSVTLTSQTQKLLHPKAPPPIPHFSNVDIVRSTVQASKQSTEILDSKKETTIDYFDMVQ
ncbi:transcriptional repressor NF-X1-like [Ptychodera flava]|uniref:transcriptional repressor NF-X1-like n=1 Tax=Ptychodera flava TaxID=63121 RepID=UPI00396A410A